MSVAEEFLALPPEAREPLIAEADEGSWDGRCVRETVRTLLEPPPATFDEAQETEVPAGSSRGVETTALSSRPGELTRSIQGLTRVPRGVCAVELVFPSLEEAERKARRRR